MKSTYILSVLYCALNASTAMATVLPEPVAPQTLRCTYETMCLAKPDSDIERNCLETLSEIKIVVRSDDQVAEVTRPNGTVAYGKAFRFEEYERFAYSAIISGDGAGVSMISVYPDYTSIWTGHFTLAENVSSNSFGKCEVIN